jgi:hypothetical protein
MPGATGALLLQLLLGTAFSSMGDVAKNGMH